MRNIIIPQPNSPSGWQAFANEQAVASIPLQAVRDVNQTSVSNPFSPLSSTAVDDYPRSENCDIPWSFPRFL